MIPLRVLRSGEGRPVRSEGPADGAPGEAKDSVGKGETAERESIAYRQTAAMRKVRSP